MSTRIDWRMGRHEDRPSSASVREEWTLISDAKARASRAGAVDDTHDLVTGNDRRPAGRKVAFDHVKVGAADAADAHANANLGGSRLRIRAAHQAKPSRAIASQR